MSEFKRVGLVARTGQDPVITSLKRVAQFLRSRDVEVWLEDEAAKMLGDSDTPNCPLSELGFHSDLVIAVGGDGNMLGAARALAPTGVPLLGVNRGRLGFLADISPDDVEEGIGTVLDGDYSIEEHFLLEGEVSVEGEVAVPCALNEVVIHSAKLPKMLEIDLYVNDKFVYNQYSDGLIVSSPTGSTAYALSAGGPIMHPAIDAIVLLPMFPHTLNSRPLVVPGDSEIRIEMGSHTGTDATVAFDSHLQFRLEPGDSLVVRKQATKLKLLHPPGHSFYSVCRSKLDWASRVGE